MTHTPRPTEVVIVPGWVLSIIRHYLFSMRGSEMKEIKKDKIK